MTTRIPVTISRGQEGTVPSTYEFRLVGTGMGTQDRIFIKIKCIAWKTADMILSRKEEQSKEEG